MLRTATATLLTVLLVPVLVTANVATWSARTVVDDEAFTRTVSRTLDGPMVDQLIAETVSTAVLRVLDRASASERLVGIQALQLPVNAGEAAIEGRVVALVDTALDDPRVQAARDEAIESGHAFLLGAARGEDGVVRIEGRDVVVDVYPIVVTAADTMDPRFVAVVQDRLDPSTTRLVVASSDGVQAVSTTVVVLDTLRWVIPLLVVAACLLIVVVAHRRVRALGAVGVAVMVAGLISLGVVWVGGVAAPSSIDDATLQAVATELYGALTWALVLQSIGLLVGGIAIALAAWSILRRRRGRRRDAAAGPRVPS